MRIIQSHATGGFLLSIFLFLLVCPLGLAQKQYQLPKPIVPLKEAGSDYLEDLEAMARYIERGKTLKFYQVATSFNKKM